MNKELDLFIKDKFKCTKEELVRLYKRDIINNGSFIIATGKGYQLNGIRNSRDQKWFINLQLDLNSTSDSCNYENVRIGEGIY